MMAETKPLSVESVEKLLELRYEARKKQDEDMVSLINDILKERQAEAERKERQAEAELEKSKLVLSNGGLPNFSGALVRFKNTLKQSGINNPAKGVLDTLVRRFPMQLTVAAEDEEKALDLYNEIKALPSTTTTARFVGEAQIYLNGPASAENVNIIVGSRSDKTPVMVKFLIATNHPTLDYKALSEGCRREAQVCKKLGLSSTTLPFVRSEVVEIEDASNIVRKAIVMPTYVRTVADSARLWPTSLIDGSTRMIQALEFMHGLDVIHMDVKGSNILIDQAGDWYLGDFGSTRAAGEAVFTTTPSFYPTSLSGLPALPKYDWFMLLVTILIELMPRKQDWAAVLCEPGLHVVTLPRVASTLANAMSSTDVIDKLKYILCDIASRAELTMPLPPPP